MARNSTYFPILSGIMQRLFQPASLRFGEYLSTLPEMPAKLRAFDSTQGLWVPVIDLFASEIPKCLSVRQCNSRFLETRSGDRRIKPLRDRAGCHEPASVRLIMPTHAQSGQLYSPELAPQDLRTSHHCLQFSECHVAGQVLHSAIRRYDDVLGVNEGKRATYPLRNLFGRLDLHA